MAGNIRGITIQFRGDTTKLDKALRQINNETKAIDRELRQVDKALKFNPTSVELWRQKQDLLKQKISETKEKLTLLKQEQARMDAEGVDKNSEEYRKLQREIIETESKVKTFEGQLKKIGNVNLRAASEQFKELGNKLTSAGEAMRGVSMAAAAVTAAIGAMTYKAGKTADEINTLSKVTGIGTEDLQKYSYAADLVDTSVDAIAKSNKRLTKSAYSAANGSTSQQEAFDKLGVSVTNADGSLRNSDDIFNDVIASLGQMSNETERDALAQQLMGKSAAELNPLIEDGGETYKKVAETMAKYNLDYVDQETLDAANQFNDELDTIKLLGTVAMQQVGAQLAGVLAPAMEKVVDLVGRLAEWLGNLDPRVLAVISAVGGIIAVVAPILLFLGKLSFAISSIMSLMATIGPALAGILATAGPIVLIIGALVAAGILLYKNWDKIKAKAQEIWAHIKLVFTNLKNDIVTIWTAIKAFLVKVWEGVKALFRAAVQVVYFLTIGKFKLMWQVIKTIFNGIRNSVRTAWNNIKTAITKPINAAVTAVRNAINKIKSIINGAHLSLPKFKLPHFRITGGKLPWGIGGKGVAPKINVDWYAKGGIFNSPSIIGVGEAGSEAVVPLDRFWDKLDNMQSGETNIVININGANSDPREIAEEVKRVLITEANRRRLAWQ